MTVNQIVISSNACAGVTSLQIKIRKTTLTPFQPTDLDETVDFLGNSFFIPDTKVGKHEIQQPRPRERFLPSHFVYLVTMMGLTAGSFLVIEYALRRWFATEPAREGGP